MAFAGVLSKNVTVKDYRVDTIHDKAGKLVGKKVVLIVDYPNVEKVEVSGAVYIKNKKITTSGLWFTLDKKDKLSYYSAVSNVLRHYKVKSVVELIGKEIETEADEKSFLVVKAY